MRSIEGRSHGRRRQKRKRKANAKVLRIWPPRCEADGSQRSQREVNGVDLEVSSSPNSYMTVRVHCNRVFGIKSVKDLQGDIEGSLKYALATVRASKAIEEGVKQERTRAEIRESMYEQYRAMSKI